MPCLRERGRAELASDILRRAGLPLPVGLLHERHGPHRLLGRIVGRGALRLRSGPQ